jgi:hypothetical protein
VAACVVLVAGRDADQAAVLRGEQDAALSEPGDQGALHLPGRRVRVVDRRGALGDGDRVGAGEEQAEAFRPFGQAAQVTSAVEQVVDELPPRGLFLPHREFLGPFVSFGESVHCLLHGGEHTVGPGG